ncbi:hypothetical protein [Ornithinimicrobium sp. W1665]|uniref:hypothetical protein n=1 Tax=Ornithinimicrobium sp. W1665 TaxID=3416666 RepID=UPI003D6A31A1
MSSSSTTWGIATVPCSRRLAHRSERSWASERSSPAPLNVLAIRSMRANTPTPEINGVRTPTVAVPSSCTRNQASRPATASSRAARADRSSLPLARTTSRSSAA